MRGFSLRRGAAIGALLCSAAVPAAAQDAPAPPLLPTADQLIDRCIEAMGGEEALKSVANGSAEVFSRTPGGEYELRFRWGGERRVLMEMTRKEGVFVIGCDGTAVWTLSPQHGYRLVRGREASNLLGGLTDFLAPFTLPGSLLSRWDGMTLDPVVRTEFGEQPCYEVRVSAPPVVQRLLFFDELTGLLAGSRTVRIGPQPNQRTTSTTYLLDYAKLTPITTFTRTRMEEDGIGERLVEFSHIEFNSVEAEVFELPNEIKRLVREEAAASDAVDDDGDDDDADREESEEAGDDGAD